MPQKIIEVFLIALRVNPVKDTTISLSISGVTIGSSTYIYVIFDIFIHFTQCSPWFYFYWGFYYIYLLYRSDYDTTPALHLCLYWYFCASYNGLCIDMFVYYIIYSFWLYLILGVFFYSSTVLSLHSYFYSYLCERYIYVHCDMLVYFIRYGQSLACIFPAYYLLCHCRHPCLPAFTKVD